MAVNVLNNFSTLQTDPLRNFKFHVNIHHIVQGRTTGSRKPLASLGFTSVSGLSMTTESIPYRQGGYNTTVHQIPGQTTFSPVTLQRGVALGTDHSWHWMRQLFSVIAGNGNFDGGGTTGGARTFRCKVDINVLDHPVTGDRNGAVDGAGTAIRMRFRLYNAWISALSYSDLNAGDNALLVEQMTIVHEGFDMHMSDTRPRTDAPAFRF